MGAAARLACWLALAGSASSLQLSDARADPRPGDAPVRIVLVGDSTVRYCTAEDDEQRCGWGQVLHPFFDPRRVEIENRAIGGRSSRTFLTEGRWEAALAGLRRGDVVMIQFGHNDGGELFEGERPRGSLKGNGDRGVTGAAAGTGELETVRSYGWYLRKYIADARARGAVPIVLSPIPRDRWREGRVVRAENDYGRWAAEAARDGGALFIDLNDLAARRFEQLGALRVGAELFTAGDHTHTTRAGARLIAACVVDGLRQLGDPRLEQLLASAARTGPAPTPVGGRATHRHPCPPDARALADRE